MGAEYVAELFNSTSTFGPNVNDKLAEVWDARNLGWSRYDRIPGPAFLTLYQTSPLLAKFVPLLTHLRITRIAAAGNVQCYSGVYVDYNSTGDDAVLHFVDYLGLLGVSRCGYKTLYPTKKLGTEIAQPEINAAIAAATSALGFMFRATMEDPLGTDGTTPIKTNAQFGTLDQTRLQLLFDLSEMGRANTTNFVTFDVDRTGPANINFWKNKGGNSNVGLVLNGSVSDYQYLPGWRRYRNDLATIGQASGGGATEIVKTDATAITAKGRRQDVFTIRTLLGVSGAATEADQQQAVAAQALKRAILPPGALSLRLQRGAITPFTGWDICDKMPVDIGNGIDAIAGRTWRIVGYREVVMEDGEHPTAIVEPVMT